ncbi:hypothetical protein HDU98_002526 [Podochytrium sp. JEL0797]|nr:hypothetical protein HDU98_002526 [Podochytrium sp. JEL0797]
MDSVHPSRSNRISRNDDPYPPQRHSYSDAPPRHASPPRERRRDGVDQQDHSTFTEHRNKMRSDARPDFWPLSPKQRHVVAAAPVKHKKKRSAKEDSESEDDRKHRKSKKKSRKHSKKSSKSKKRSRRDVSDSDSTDNSDSDRDSVAAEKDESARVKVDHEAEEKEAQEFWQEKTVIVNNDDEEFGPVPLPEQDNKLDKRAYGGSLLAGEGSALAAYVQSGQRIPRRGEIGLNDDEILAFENSGYVMSGSRHRRMNAVRIRKENQVISAEEKNALLMFAQQEKLRKETETIALLKEMVAAKIKPKE